MLAANPGPRVINVGAGQGTMSELLERRGFDVVSVDPSDQAVALLRGRCRGEVVSAVAESLPFADATFDAAVLGEVLEHLDDDVAGLREVKRVLRPGAVVAVSVPRNPAWFGPSDEWAGHRRRYTRQAIIELLAGAGLRVERLRPWGFPLSTVYHRHIYEPRLAKVGPGPPRRALRPLVAVLDAGLQVDRAFVGVERGALGYLAVARVPAG